MKHGTSKAYLRDRCRCPECIAANTRYHKRWRNDREQGRPRTVPAVRVQRHVQRLLDSGMTTGQVAAAAGLNSHRIVWDLMHMDRTYVRVHIAAALFAVGPEQLPTGLPDDSEVFVPCEPSRRRIRALLALGWRHDDIYARCGIRTHVLLHQTSPRVTWRNHLRIARMYDALSTSAGPSQRTRTRAAAAGYLPPAAWDDDSLDLVSAGPPCQDSSNDTPLVDEIAVERFIAGDLDWKILTTEERTAAAVHMDRLGYSRNVIAERTHLRSQTLWAALRAADPVNATSDTPTMREAS